MSRQAGDPPHWNAANPTEISANQATTISVTCSPTSRTMIVASRCAQRRFDEGPGSEGSIQPATLTSANGASSTHSARVHDLEVNPPHE